MFIRLLKDLQEKMIHVTIFHEVHSDFVQRMLEKRFSTDLASFCDRVLLKTFQNLSVSSPAPVTIDSPSGDMACFEIRIMSKH